MSDENNIHEVPFEQEFFNPDDFTPADPESLAAFDATLKDKIIELAKQSGKYEHKREVTVGLVDHEAENSGDTYLQRLAINFDHTTEVVDGKESESYTIRRRATKNGGTDFNLFWSTESPVVAVWKWREGNELSGDEREELQGELTVIALDLEAMVEHEDDQVATSMLKGIKLVQEVLGGNMLGREDIAAVVDEATTGDRESVEVVHASAESSLDDDGSEVMLRLSDLMIRTGDTIGFRQKVLHLDEWGSKKGEGLRPHPIAYDLSLSYNAEQSQDVSIKREVKFKGDDEPEAIPNEHTPEEMSAQQQIGAATLGLTVSGDPEFMEGIVREMRNGQAGVYDVTVAKLERLKTYLASL